MFSFTKQERLCSKKAIELLYTKGKTKNFFPLKVFVSENKKEHPYPVRFMVSVPKKRIRLAVKRNRVKRLMKEAWRLNKHQLYEQLNKHNKRCDVMLLWLSNDIPELKDIQQKMPQVFNFILGEINKD